MQQAYKIINDIKNGNYSSVYILCGEELFFIDKVIQTAEEFFVDNDKHTFDKHVFFGKETNLQDIINICGQFSMFGDKQFVLLKNAELKKDDFDLLTTYISDAAPQTILMISLKSKLDKRSKLYKSAKDKSVFLETKQLYDNQLPDFINGLIQQKSWKCSTKVLHLISDHIGNNLSRVESELGKLDLFIPENGELTVDLVEKYMGISKEYNNFEWVDAIADRNQNKALKLALHFGKDSKNYPFMLSVSILYNFFTNLLVYHTLQDKSSMNAAKALKVPPTITEKYKKAYRNYTLKQVTHSLKVIHKSYMEAVGIETSKDEKAKFVSLCLNILS